jgi:phosphatidylglycerol:prolipoprotein diacylglycerol transferase
MSAVTMLVGSRLLHWWTHPAIYQQDPWRVASFSFRDFSLFGGLLLAGLTGMICCWVTRIDFWRLADCIAPALGLGIALTRVGCFLSGCCFGVETHLPWGVIYPSGSPAHMHQAGGDFLAIFSGCQAVHPTQIYELMAAGSAALLAFVLLQRQFPSGVPFLAATIVFCGFRWFNDPLRVHANTLVTTAWSYSTLYAVLAVIGIAVLFWRMRATPTRRLACLQ